MDRDVILLGAKSAFTNRIISLRLAVMDRSRSTGKAPCSRTGENESTSCYSPSPCSDSNSNRMTSMRFFRESSETVVNVEFRENDVLEIVKISKNLKHYDICLNQAYGVGNPKVE